MTDPTARQIDDRRGAAMGGGKDPRREARPLVVARTHADAVRYVQKEMGKRIHEVVVVATTAPSPALLRHRITEDDVHWVPGWDQAPKAAMVEAEIHHLIRSRP